MTVARKHLAVLDLRHGATPFWTDKPLPIKQGFFHLGMVLDFALIEDVVERHPGSLIARLASYV